MRLVGPGRTAGRIAALRFLPFADLNQQAAAGGQPQRSLRGHPAQDVQAVAAAVQRHPWLVQPGLGRQQPDLPGGHVRHVGDQDVHAAAQRGGQRLEEVDRSRRGRRRGEVAAGAGHRGGVDVGGVQLGGVQGGGERGAHRAGTAAQVDDHRARRGEPNSLADQELGAAAGHEDAGNPRLSAGRRSPPSRRPVPEAGRIPAGPPWRSSSAGVVAAEMSNSASSSANTHPADRSLVTMADRETGEGVTGIRAPGDLVSARPGPAGRTCRATTRRPGAGYARAPGPRRCRTGPRSAAIRPASAPGGQPDRAGSGPAAGIW